MKPLLDMARESAKRGTLLAWLRAHPEMCGCYLGEVASQASAALGVPVSGSQVMSAFLEIGRQDRGSAKMADDVQEQPQPVKAGRGAKCGRRGSLRWREDMPPVEEVEAELAARCGHVHQQHVPARSKR